TGQDGEAIGGDPGDQGEKGWSPEFAAVADGADRQVLELVDWQGGEGTKPSYGNLYVGTTGFVSTKAAAANIKGEQGDAAVASLTPISEFAAYLTTDIAAKNGTSLITKNIVNPYSRRALVQISVAITYSAIIDFSNLYYRMRINGTLIASSYYAMEAASKTTVYMTYMRHIDADETLSISVEQGLGDNSSRLSATTRKLDAQLIAF
ncbi:MAG: hypothetical protein ACPGUG_16330, partial [Pseudoalteromonas marina]